MIIYLYGNEWQIFTTEDGRYMMRLERDDRSRVVLAIPEDVAQQIVNLFVSVENLRHEATIKRLTDPESE